MIITIDTSIPFSDTDMAVLQALDAEHPALRHLAKPAPKAAPPAKAEEAPPAKPAPKAAPPAKPAPKAAPPAKAEAESGSPTLSDAVAAATKLVSSGKTSVVKSALETVGAARVSELSEDKIADFLSALEE